MRLFLIRFSRRAKFEFKNYKFRLFTPRFPRVTFVESPVKLGSLYGQKFLLQSKVPGNPILVSGGVGEDVSFDIEFLNNFGGVGYLYDPTERAIKHIEKVKNNIGSLKISEYSNDGTQPINSYDLRNLKALSLQFFPLALLDKVRKVRFYAPPNEEHVSFSVQNIQNDFGDNGKFVEVDAIGPEEVLSHIGGKHLDVLKLDIEGSEYFFLRSLFSLGVYPTQVLVEIDELSFPSLKSRKMARLLFGIMKRNDYLLVHRAGFELTYFRDVKS